MAKIKQYFSLVRVSVAAPIAKQVLFDSITALNIQKREDGILKKYNYLDRKYAVIPNVTSKTVNDAMKELKSFKVEFSGSGDKVAYQSPIAGTRIYEGETVRLMLTN